MENDGKRRTKYAKLYDSLIQLLQQMKARGENCLPSERELCESYRVSRITVRRALADLEKDGYIFRIQGKGAFIGDEKFRQPLSALTSFTQDMQAQNQRSGAKILAMELLPAAGHVAEKLQVTAGETVVLLRRLRMLNDVPLAIENCYLPIKYGKAVLEFMTDNMSLYSLLQEKCGVIPVSADQYLEVGPLLLWEQALFGDKVPPYAMCTTRQAFDAKGQVVEYVEGKYRADRYSYHIHMQSQQLHGQYCP